MHLCILHRKKLSWGGGILGDFKFLFPFCRVCCFTMSTYYFYSKGIQVAKTLLWNSDQVSDHTQKHVGHACLLKEGLLVMGLRYQHRPGDCNSNVLGFVCYASA